ARLRARNAGGRLFTAGRDGVTLTADACSGVDGTPRPAPVALSPCGKELRALAPCSPRRRHGE
ncbi:hypothetical protein ABTY20_29740, partial [Streptomyces sp. NPDC126497]|uniref:hypothetical protein n=1 Tax=Streptomyces sp. NPDC126497 TaxID=3155313 RepID=UPI00332831CA